jgi:hypothetical protein
MPNPYHKRYVHVVNLPQKSFQLLSYVVAKGLFSAGPILVWAHEFHKEFTQCAMCLDAHVIWSYFVQNLIQILDFAIELLANNGVTFLCWSLLALSYRDIGGNSWKAVKRQRNFSK